MQILQNTDLKLQNTFGIAATAAYYIILEHIEDIQLALQEYGKPDYILGSGSNVLLTKDIDGILRHPAFHGIQEDFSHRDKTLLTVGAGENMHDIVQYTTQKGRWGLENLVAIPGCVGAAPVQNIGAYGLELKDIFVSCTAFDLGKNTFVKLYKDDCKFEYRNSIFKQHPGRYLITEVTLTISTQPKPIITYGGVYDALEKKGYIESGNNEYGSITPSKIAKTIEEIRRSKLPKPSELGNTGSFFKNPCVEDSLAKKLLEKNHNMPCFTETNGLIKIPAARLIEHAGVKGYRKGNVGTYEKQPLIIVNYGGATGQEIFEFSEYIIKTVHEKFEIKLEREVNVW